MLILVGIYVLGFATLFCAINPDYDEISNKDILVEKFLCSVAWPFGLFCWLLFITAYALVKDKLDGTKNESQQSKVRQKES
jgi:hypothetical protein